VSDLVYISSPREDGFVSLSKTASGRLLRKMVLPMGSFVHPADHNTKIVVDKSLAQKMVDNFNKGFCDIVQVPVVDGANKHVEDPLRNAGEVIDLDYDDKGIYATIDARKYQDDFGKTLLGCSAMMHLNYTDTKTGQKVGPTLLHVAVTNRPYVTNMDGYQDLAALSADNQGENPVLLVAEEELQLSSTTKETGPMTVDELIAALKEKGIDVPALQAEATRAAELSGQLDEVNAQLQLSNSEGLSVKDLAEAVVELSNNSKALTAQVQELKDEKAALKLSAAEAEVDSLIKQARILPAQRDAMVKLSVNDRETFDAIVPATALVSLSEAGATVHEAPDAAHADKVKHYTEIAEKLNRGFKK
jgi:hypothetical protein